jgi:hypothetical protein
MSCRYAIDWAEDSFWVQSIQTDGPEAGRVIAEILVFDDRMDELSALIDDARRAVERRRVANAEVSP